MLSKTRHHQIPRALVWLRHQSEKPCSLIERTRFRQRAYNRIPSEGILHRHSIKHLACVIQTPTFCIDINQPVLNENLRGKLGLQDAGMDFKYVIG
ncbi:hypothetical protein LguiB_032460 [Lonicera macranthoides]